MKNQTFGIGIETTALPYAKEDLLTMALGISQPRREEWYRHNSEAGYYWELLARHHYDHSHLPTAEPAFEVPPFLFRTFINPVIMLHRILFSLSILISMFTFIISRLD